MLELLPPTIVHGHHLDLDTDQRAVLEHTGSLLTVVGGPGSGKTTLVAEFVAARVHEDGLAAEQCLVLAPTRRAAARARERVTLRIGATTGDPLARTPHSFAFGLLRRAAAATGEPAPRLITGPEQDVILRELLDGHSRGAREGRDEALPSWPEALRQALPTRTFRGELRDLLMRAVELELDPEDLEDLGDRHDRPEWRAAGAVLREYDQITALSAPGAMDPAWIVGAAARLLEDDPQVLADVGRQVRVVVVDDAQDLTAAGLRLVRQLARAGARVVLFADPDQATQSFRGGDPRLVLEAFPEGERLTLTHGHRLTGEIAHAATWVAHHIGSLGMVRHRRLLPVSPAVPGGDAVPRDGGLTTAYDAGGKPAGEESPYAVAPGALAVHLFRTSAQEAAWIADQLRRQHLLVGVPWAAMAIVVRGGARAATLERILRAAGIPVAERSSDVAVRDDPAVRPFLLLLEAVLGAKELDPDVALELIHSRLGAVDAVQVRRLRRALRRQELSAGGSRRSGDLLVAALEDPVALAPIGPEGEGARRVALTFRAGREAAKVEGASAETILWAMWQASGLGPPWRDWALAGGRGGRRADRALDAIVALFEAAARHTERLPGSDPRSFLDHLQSQELVADTIAARAPLGEAVEIVTPADAAGREWAVVAIAGVQEGVWPDLRLRGQLLGAQDLVDAHRGVVSDRRAARAAVRHDEIRLFHVALSRATRQCLVTAVRSDDEQPSVLLDLVQPVPPTSEGRSFTEPPSPFSLVGAVAGLRQELVSGDLGRRGQALTTLGRLSAEGVRGAAPESWWALTEVTDTRDRRDRGAPVRVSPSRLDRFSACPLQWFLSGCGAQGPSLGAGQLGSLVHEIADDLGDTTATAYIAAVRERWPRLGLGDGWVSRKDQALAETMVGRLAEHVDAALAQGWTRHGSEVTVSVRVGRAQVEGRVDRVEAGPEGRLRIIDLKTGASKPKVEELARHGQLGAYQVAVDAGALGDHHSGGAALLHLGKAHSRRTPLQVQGPLSEDPDPSWAHERLAADAEVMAGAQFDAAPGGGLCGTCAVQSSCPARPEGRRLV